MTSEPAASAAEGAPKDNQKGDGLAFGAASPQQEPDGAGDSMRAGGAA